MIAMAKPGIIALVCLALFLMCGMALAQFNGCRAGFCPGGIGTGPGFGPSAGGGITPPAGCSNRLDFSDGCNSQYLL